MSHGCLSLSTQVDLITIRKYSSFSSIKPALKGHYGQIRVRYTSINLSVDANGSTGKLLIWWLEACDREKEKDEVTRISLLPSYLPSGGGGEANAGSEEGLARQETSEGASRKISIALATVADGDIGERDLGGDGSGGQRRRRMEGEGEDEGETGRHRRSGVSHRRLRRLPVSLFFSLRNLW